MTDGRLPRIHRAIAFYLNDGNDMDDDEAPTEEELEAVTMALDELQAIDRYADEKMTFYELIFSDGKTLTAAADDCYISYATAKRWKSQIIDLVSGELPDL